MLTAPTLTRIETVFCLENEHLKFDLRSDASSEILVKKSGAIWRQGPVAYQHDGDFNQQWGWTLGKIPSFATFPGRFSLRREGDVIQAVLRDELGYEIGGFTVKYDLVGPHLEVRILHIDESIPSLCYPTPIQNSALLIPRQQGEILRAEDQHRDYGAHKWERRFIRNPHLNMRWIGGLEDNNESNGWIAIFAEGFEDAGALLSGAWASPAWTRSLDTWNTRRCLRYTFTSGGFVGAAKAFRSWARESGLWGTSLREKLAANPLLDCMVGGRKIRLTLGLSRHPRRYEDSLSIASEDLPEEGRFEALMDYRETQRLVDSIKASGMKRGVFKFGGWGKGGYDERHPDIWPPAEELGTLAEFKALCAQEPPLMTCLHDSYYDLYSHVPDFPKGACMDQRGRPFRVGFWNGGQAYPANPRNMIAPARSNAVEMRKAGCTNHYFDSFSFLHQSFEPGNTLTRTEDATAKKQIFDNSRALGMLTGSEDGADFYVANTHWSPKGKWGITSNSVPLWNLVFNDAHLGYRIINKDNDKRPASKTTHDRRALENLLLGYAPTYMFHSFKQWEDERELFQSTYFNDAWHREIALEEMVDHQILSPDGLVRRSIFGSGKAVVANLSDQAYEVDGQSLASRGHRFE